MYVCVCECVWVLGINQLMAGNVWFDEKGGRGKGRMAAGSWAMSK